MSCPIERSESHGANGKIVHYKFSLIKPINGSVLEKLNERSANTNLPRSTAFATISLLDAEHEELLATYLGQAVNRESFPEDLKAMFAADGSVLPSKRSKIAYLGFLDRENKNFKQDKKIGTFVKHGNIESIFGKAPSTINSNSVLKKYYLADEDETKRTLQLVRGSASQLLECLLGSTSPLHELGVEYVILHPVSRELETNYYGRKFGFKPALGIPSSLASFVMMNNPTNEDEESLVENFEYFDDAPSEQGGPIIKKWNNYLLRVLDNRVYQVYESTSTGPIMYKKIAPPEQQELKPETILPESEPKNLSKTKPGTKRTSAKQLARLLLNRARKGTRKQFAPSKQQVSKRTMKLKPKHRG